MARFASPPAAAALRSPWSGRLLGVVMPTYGGTMMALVMPRFLGLYLAGWQMAAAAAVGSVTMGGAAVTAEWQRGRSRRIGQATASLRSAADGFQAALTEQIRDTITLAQQDLRRSLARSVSNRGRLLSAEVRAARIAAEDSGRTQDAVRDIDDDLVSIRALGRRALRVARLDGVEAPAGDVAQSWGRAS